MYKGKSGSKTTDIKKYIYAMWNEETDKAKAIYLDLLEHYEAKYDFLGKIYLAEKINKIEQKMKIKYGI